MTDLPPPHAIRKNNSPHAWLVHRWTGPLVLVAAAIAMLIWTWGRYGHPFVDFGREAYVAWRLSAGDVLYRDIDYFNGPVSPYLNALIFRLFGPSLLCLEIANLLWWGLLVVMAYRLYLAMSDRLSAFGATLLFIALFSLVQLVGIGNYNFVTPYAHEVTHSLVCAFAALTLLWSYLRRLHPMALAGCGALLGVMFLMKVEVTAATAAALAVGIALRLFSATAAPRLWIRTVLIVIAGAIVPSLIAFALLRLAMTSQQALGGVLGSWKYLRDAAITDNVFYRRVMGTDKTFAHTVLMLEIFAGELLLLVPPFALSVLIRRNISSDTRAVCAIGSAGYVVVLLWVFWDSADWQAAVRPLNLISVLTVLAFAVLAGRERRQLSPRLILQLSFSVFSAVLLSKIFFNIAIYHYGFALAAPAFALLVMLLLGWLPTAIHRGGGTEWIFRAATIAVLGAFCLKHLMAYQNFYRGHPVQSIGSGADQMCVYENAEAINQVLNFLTKLPADQTVATVPQGALINYLSRRVNPTGELTLLPGEVEMFGEKRILDRFEANPPDWIVAVQTNVTEFGYTGFGIDYAQEIVRFIKENYDPVAMSRSNNLKSDLHLFRFDPAHWMRDRSGAIPPAPHETGLNSAAGPGAGEDADHRQ